MNYKQQSMERAEKAIREIGYVVVQWKSGALRGEVCNLWEAPDGSLFSLPQPLVVLCETDQSDRDLYEKVTGAARDFLSQGRRYYRFMTD